MSTTATMDRCSVCGALVDEEDLFCTNCGTEVPAAEGSRPGTLAIEARNFRCKGCGASMNYDASAQSLKCPFCGSVDLNEDRGRGILAPELVIPFGIDRVEAERRLWAWLGSGFWHPGDLRTTARLDDLRPVYVPFWIFSSRVSTHWTADSSRTPPGASADWFPLSGTRRAEYDNLWVPASSGVPVGEVRSVLPFDSDAALPPGRVDLKDVTVEQFQVSRRYARPLARELVESLESRAVADEVPGRSRNVHVNVLLEGTTSRAALAPLYVLAYRYRDQLYRYVINGQTGEATGSAPFAFGKLAGIVGAVALFALILILLGFLFAG